MKKIYLLLLPALLMFSCSDPCKDVVCENYGNCIDGACECQIGYEGTSCETHIFTAYSGVYTGTYIEDGVSFSNHSTDLFPVAGVSVRVEIGNFSADFYSNTAFRIPNQAFTANGEYVTVNSGQGTCDGSSLSFEVEFRADGMTHSASFTGTK